jgi:hypothetical protein
VLHGDRGISIFSIKAKSVLTVTKERAFINALFLGLDRPQIQPLLALSGYQTWEPEMSAVWAPVRVDEATPSFDFRNDPLAALQSG